MNGTQLLLYSWYMVHSCYQLVSGTQLLLAGKWYAAATSW